MIRDYCLTSENAQTFKLASGELQTAVGKIKTIYKLYVLYSSCGLSFTS